MIEVKTIKDLCRALSQLIEDDEISLRTSEARDFYESEIKPFAISVTQEDILLTVRIPAGLEYVVGTDPLDEMDWAEVLEFDGEQVPAEIEDLRYTQ